MKKLSTFDIHKRQFEKPFTDELKRSAPTTHDAQVAFYTVPYTAGKDANAVPQPEPNQ